MFCIPISVLFLIQAVGQYLVDAGHEVYEVIPHLYSDKLKKSKVKPIEYQLNPVRKSQFI